jgi:glycosyltransferase involved in cell wall biosynthesis
MKPLNLFYEEPESDRFLPLDRHPRRIIRRIVRGEPNIGGHMRVFLNLKAGLDRLGIGYRVNDYRYIKQHPEEVAGIIGKPHLLDKIAWKNRLLFGAAIFSHPCEDPEIFKRLPVSKILVPGSWVREMFAPYYGDRVVAWPVGIDTDRWQPTPKAGKDIDILLYDKVRWEHEEYEASLIEPIRRQLQLQGLKVAEIRYGYYEEADFQELLGRSKAMLFFCEHETQGIAYQQALSCGVPILAWDRGGFWQDPSYYPHKVEFKSVSSVPYWDDRCGVKFADIDEFPDKLADFFKQLNGFAPRNYILENLTLEKCARQYVDMWHQVEASKA